MRHSLFALPSLKRVQSLPRIHFRGDNKQVQVTPVILNLFQNLVFSICYVLLEILKQVQDDSRQVLTINRFRACPEFISVVTIRTFYECIKRNILKIRDSEIILNQVQHRIQNDIMYVFRIMTQPVMGGD